MNARDLIFWTSKTLTANRSRSGLTVLGFAVGIIAVTLLGSMGEGLRSYIMQEFTQFGTNILAVTPGKTDTMGLSSILNTVRPLSLADAEAMTSLSTTEKVVPIVMGNAKIKHGARGRYTDVAGVGPDALEGWVLRMAEGQFLPRDDWQHARPTAVLGHKVWRELFGNRPAIGEYLQIGGSRFRVVGVTAPKGQLLGYDMDDIVYIPVARALQLFNRESLMELDIYYHLNATTASVRNSVRDLLIQRHGVEDFTIITQDEMLASLDKILGVIKAAAAGLGVVSLFVGGVGILTIMLITVRERTWEIGLLAALGFTPNQIRNLFLCEAVFLALVGSALGLAVVSAIILAVTLFYPLLPLVLDPFMVFLALLLAIVVGLLAGVKPASNAANMKPIDALRAE